MKLMKTETYRNGTIKTYKENNTYKVKYEITKGRDKTCGTIPGNDFTELIQLAKDNIDNFINTME